jgi:hypothetical protein
MARSARDVQEQLDPWFRKVGLRAPLPPAGQSANHYLAEQCVFLKREFLPRNHDLYKPQYRSIRDDSATLNAFVPQLLNAVVTEAFNPHNPINVVKGQEQAARAAKEGKYYDGLRKIEVQDEMGVTRQIKFIGPESFVKAMGRPGRRVVSTCRPVDHSGRSCESLTIGRPLR